MLQKALKENYLKVPRSIRKFLMLALIVFVCWQALYHFVLQPARIPDRYLTDVTTVFTAKALSPFYNNPQAYFLGTPKPAVAIGTERKTIVNRIADPCNALDIYVLYIAFLFCFPATNKRRLLFLAIGIPVIFIVNIVRCALIAWLNISHKNWVDFSHHYVFTTIMYVLVFCLWVLFTRQEFRNHEQAPAPMQA